MTHDLSALPATVRTRLDDLRVVLRATLGESLTALLVYGSLPRGEYRPDYSDVDVLLVLAAPTRASLESIAGPLQLARNAARIECMILDAAEIPHAADVFPLLYDDIRRCHILLHGVDPFADLRIDPAHIRLRIEQELREARIRLRRMVADGGGRRAALRGAVERKLKQIREPLAALLRLRGEPDVPEALADVLTRAAAVYGLDPAPLLDPAADPAAAHDRLAALFTAAIDDVNAR
ncbi:MAG: nucleotidyltransferase domain-containing protein [Myxococcales bacterium]|nr:nucleotidyltransferase domain-containing protein [Myxococcales bacterium]